MGREYQTGGGSSSSPDWRPPLRLERGPQLLAALLERRAILELLPVDNLAGLLDAQLKPYPVVPLADAHAEFAKDASDVHRDTMWAPQLGIRDHRSRPCERLASIWRYPSSTNAGQSGASRSVKRR